MEWLTTSIDGNEIEIGYDAWTDGDDHGRTWPRYQIRKVKFEWLNGMEIDVRGETEGKISELLKILVGAMDQELESEKLEAQLRVRGE